MFFADKLDFVMKITDTSNSRLAHHISVDPSYISRIRRGQRNIPKDEQFIDSISAFFSKLCTADYRRNALAEAMSNSYVKTISDIDEISHLLKEWFVSNDSTDDGTTDKQTPISIKTLLSSVAEAKSPAQMEEDNHNILTFYGPEGRKKVTLSLLHMALLQPEPKVLLLFSDEDSYSGGEGNNFYQERKDLLWQIIAKGHKIIIIHKVSRDIDEMLSVINHWLPFYLTGNVEPYYYPKLRDGVYKRTLSILPSLAVIFATSIGENMENTPIFLSTDRATIDSFKNEFYSYLSLCKPLISIYQSDRRFNILSCFLKFESFESAIVLKSQGLPRSTMPIEVLKSMHKNNSVVPAEQLILMHEDWIQTFEKRLSTFETSHIIKIDNIINIISGKAFTINVDNSNNEKILAYTAKEYSLHLDNIVRLLEKYENYKVIIDDSPATGYTINVAEDCGVLVMKSSDSPVAFEIKEPNMISAFWDYIRETTENIRQLSRNSTIEFLQKLSFELKEK